MKIEKRRVRDWDACVLTRKGEEIRARKTTTGMTRLDGQPFSFILISFHSLVLCQTKPLTLPFAKLSTLVTLAPIHGCCLVRKFGPKSFGPLLQ